MAAPARAECPTPGPSGGPAPVLPGTYSAPAFRMSAKNEFLDGAIYDRSGRVLCVLPGNRAAYAYTGTLPSGPITEAFCAQATQDVASGGASGITRLGPSNNDLLRRVVWMYGEGGCNPADTACAPLGNHCAPAPAGEFGSRYFAYVIKNLRKSYSSDDAMLRSACRDDHQSFYDLYFVQGTRYTSKAIAALKEPARWLSYPPPAGSPACGSDEGCWARGRVQRCLQDVIAAELDTANASSPFTTPVNAWLGELNPPAIDRGRVCPKTWPRVLVRSWANLPMLHCFHKY